MISKVADVSSNLVMTGTKKCLFEGNISELRLAAGYEKEEGADEGTNKRKMPRFCQIYSEVEVKREMGA